MMENKKGQGMSTTTIVLLVLGLIILVVLVLGFTIGWQKFAPFLSNNNIDSVKTACSVACSTGSQYEYCTLQRDVKDGVNDKFQSTCFLLSSDSAQNGYGIDPCPTISCS